jgi:hypothetical protein
MARWGAIHVQLETVRTGSLRVGGECVPNGVAAGEGAQVPGKGENIAPMAIRDEQSRSGFEVGGGQSDVKLVEPVGYHFTNHGIGQSG